MSKLFLILAFLYLFIPDEEIYGQHMDYGRSVVGILASDSLKGRGYVDEGHLMAADFIAHEFEALGLLPLKRKYRQTFKQAINTFPDSVKLMLDNTLLTPGKDYLVEPFSPSLEGAFPIVKINKSLLLETEQLRAALQNIEGKVLVIDERNFAAENKALEEKAEETMNVLKYNPQIPNVATLVLTKKKLTWHIADMQAAKPVITIKSDKNYNDLQEVKIDINASLSTHKLENLAGYIKGRVKPDSFLVLTAHYDHLGMMGKETIFNGANDNSSGVAMLLSLARHFAVNPPEYSVVFLALAAEELGLVGAKQFVDHPQVELSKIKFLLNFDLAGTGDEGIMVVNATVFKEQFSRLEKLNREGHYLEAVKKRGEACISDHCIFYQAGVPSFYIYTLGGISAYHDIYDRPETLPLTEFEDYARLMIEFLEGF